jgi:hypothetical protein
MRLALCVGVIWLVLAAVAHPAAALVADPDYWRQSADRRDTLYRFFYRQSPQAVPSSYDPVAEAEQILRERQAALPASNPQAPSLWQQVRGITVRQALSTPARGLGTVGLGLGAFWAGWKIGSGAHAIWQKISVPEAGEVADSYRWDEIKWSPALSEEYGGARWPAEDGWVIWARQNCCNYSPLRAWHNWPCRLSGFVPPEPSEIRGPLPTDTQCYGTGVEPGYADLDIYYGWAPEDALKPAGPVEDYTDQPYSHATPAVPDPPPQTTVEQGIDNDLEQPENSLVRQWLNYQLGSPGETDPLGIGEPRPDIDFPNREEKWEIHRHDFDHEHADVDEYWRDAPDVIRKVEDGWPDFEKCIRESDQAEIYWDPEREVIVIVKDGVIDNFFPPRSPIDPSDTGYARRYYESQCP